MFKSISLYVHIDLDDYVNTYSKIFTCNIKVAVKIQLSICTWIIIIKKKNREKWKGLDVNFRSSCTHPDPGNIIILSPMIKCLPIPAVPTKRFGINILTGRGWLPGSLCSIFFLLKFSSELLPRLHLHSSTRCMSTLFKSSSEYLQRSYRIFIWNCNPIFMSVSIRES